MHILFIGGTGTISTSCSVLAEAKGLELTLLNRGKTGGMLPQGAHCIIADMNDRADVEQKLKGREFDVVVNWIAYHRPQVERDYYLFAERCKQYVFISSASAYKKPARLPVTEAWPLDNPFWQYSRDKIACELYLQEMYEKNNFPVTIVRPSHTYDAGKIPLRGGWTSLQRMIAGKPVFIHGDGTSVWTLTHSRDFAKGFVGLLANPKAIGEAFHITSDEWLTWNEIYQTFADIFNIELHARYFTSKKIAEFDAETGAGLLGDKAHSMIFDNSKIKAIVSEFQASIPFRQGAEEIAAWYSENESCRIPDANILKLFKKMGLE